MPVTKLSDVIVPELFTPYVVNRTMELSALFQSGIITNNAEFDRLASEAAPIHQMPFFEDLSGDSEDDAQGQLTAVAMHSATKAFLKKNNLIDTERDSTDVEFDTYQGRRVIVDDGCPVADGVYTTYLFGQGAIAFGNGSPVGFVATEVDRDKKKGSGVDYLINRKTFIMHARGIKWTDLAREHVETPTKAELMNAINYERVYEPKQIRIVAFKHKIG